MTALAAVDSSAWTGANARGERARIRVHRISQKLRRVADFVVGAIAAATPAILRDVSGLAGAGLIAYGVWLVYPPCGFIAGGAFLLVGSFLSSEA